MVNKIGLSFLFAATVFVCSGCPDPFNKEEVKGDVVTPLPAPEKAKLTKHGATEIKNLSVAAQKEVGDVFFSYFVSFKWIKLTKKICHVKGLAAGKKCLAVRTKCLAEIPPDLTDAKVVAELNKNAADVKRSIADFLNIAEITAEDLILLFDIFQDNLEKALSLDCDSTAAQKQSLEDTIKGDLLTRYGKAKLDKLEAAGRKMQKLFK